MAYVPGFQNDVLISFLPADNGEEVYGGTWVDRLIAHVSITARRRLGRPVYIIRDRSTEPADLAREIERSVMFVAIVSPAYLANEATRRALARLRDAGDRLLVVELLPPDPADRSAMLADIPTVPFWQEEAGALTPLTMDRNRIRFLEKVGLVAGVVAGRLSDMREAALANAPPEAAPASDVPPKGGPVEPAAPAPAAATPAETAPVQATDPAPAMESPPSSAPPAQAAAAPPPARGGMRLAATLAIGVLVAGIVAVWMFRQEIGAAAEPLLRMLRAQ